MEITVPSERNNREVPCPKCRREDDDHTVQAYFSDALLEYLEVDSIHDLTEEEVYESYGTEHGESSVPVCRPCISESRLARIVR